MKRKRPTKDDDEYESEGDNDYDLDDPFLDDSDDEDVGEEEEDENYEPNHEDLTVDPELMKEEHWNAKPDDTPEVLDLLKEARDYLRNKKLHK